MSLRLRIDQLLVKRGYFDSRAAARAAIDAGGVFVEGRRVSKAAMLAAEDAEIEAVAAHPYVSRGGLKLAHALDVFQVDPDGRHCVDLGASTGGFTDVLLRRGAMHVLAVDVGHGQLHASLREDPRVTCLEKTDIRVLPPDQLSPDTSLLAADLSFISLSKALGPVLSQTPTGTDLVALFKPQYEVGRAHVGKGGLVTDPAATYRASETFEHWLAAQNWRLVGWTESPIKGGDGNEERLCHARKR